MAAGNWHELVAQMRARGINFDSGLTDTEVKVVEDRFGFQFPSDLKAFLQTALPRGKEFPDWRAGDESELREWLDLPLRGILFDIEHNNFWLEEWGTRPVSLDEAMRAVKNLFAAAPRLIPIFKHRMMPAEPNSAGNPVFSVHQTDIIIYGADLEDYLRIEFKLPKGMHRFDEIRQIRFWDIDRFQKVRWAGGSCFTDPSTLQDSIKNAPVVDINTLPEDIRNAIKRIQAEVIRKRDGGSS